MRATTLAAEGHKDCEGSSGGGRQVQALLDLSQARLDSGDTLADREIGDLALFQLGVGALGVAVKSP